MGNGARHVQVTFDCENAPALARFWCSVLGYAIHQASTEDDATWSAASDPHGVGPRLYFQQVPEGKVVKNRVHLDVRIAENLGGTERVNVLEAEGARLVSLGATRLTLLPATDGDESCLVMQDPEGNEFCLD